MCYRHLILVPGATGHDDPEALRRVIEDTAYTPDDAFIEDLEDLLSEMEDLLGTLDSAAGNHFGDIDEEREALKFLHERVRACVLDVERSLTRTRNH